MADIELHAIEKRYGDTRVVNGVSLTIRDGEFLTLVGPSGCGKSTLLRIIAGLEAQDGGEVRVGGTCVDDRRPKERDVAMVFQSYALYPHLSVFDNIALPLRTRRLSFAERLPLVGRAFPRRRGIERAIRAEVEQAAAMLDVAHLLHRKPGQLSGGQRQRVALGRAMVRHPAVFLMDEPLSNLDAKMRVSVRRELRSLQQRLGLTTIFVTHDQEEANTICDRIAVMDAGKVQQVGTPMELYENPANLFVANFLGSANILDERAGVPMPAGKRLVFRPQHAGLTSPEGAALRGPVTHREFLGATVRYAVRIGDSEVLIETPFQSGRELRDVGDNVGVDLPPRRMLFLPA
ncbi:ABC transporter ATP-binding protein [Reyranella sp.]|uniref:ABC transporter ATP-binding protein n=1 Tax=Reyranella sp. TaxID=1929291 RepID=UPI002619C942|nr:ABC transporter ATP-binding protein [Reyranella sp.]